MCQKIQLKHPKWRHEGILHPKQNSSPLKPCGDQSKLQFWSFQNQGEPPDAPARKGSTEVVRNSWRVKVLECRNRDQTSQEQRKFWNAGTGIKHPRSRGSWEITQDQVRAEFQRNPERQLESGLLQTCSSLPRIIPGIIFNSWHCCPRNASRAVFSNKVTFKQGKYKYVLGPFVLCHPKEPKDSFLTQLCKIITKYQL